MCTYVWQETSSIEKATKNGLKAVENGGRGWIGTSDPLRLKAVLSTIGNVKSTTYAHRSRVYVTGMDWSGHI